MDEEIHDLKISIRIVDIDLIKQHHCRSRLDVNDKLTIFKVFSFTDFSF